MFPWVPSEFQDLPPKPAGKIKIEVHFDFDLNGILTVTSTEKGKGQQEKIIVSNTGVQRLSSHELNQARADLAALFQSDETIDVSAITETDVSEIPQELAELIQRGSRDYF